PPQLIPRFTCSSVPHRRLHADLPSSPTRRSSDLRSHSSLPCSLLRAFRLFRRGPSATEWEIEAAQQFARLIVGLGRRADDHVHAPHLVDLVVVDLGEHDVLLQAERIVAAAIEAPWVQPTEVLHAG